MPDAFPRIVPESIRHANACRIFFADSLSSPLFAPLYQALGIYLPLITTNCGVLGIALISVNRDFNAVESFLAGFSAGMGFLMALLFMSGIRERLDTEKVPKYLRGAPIAFISGGLMALAFMAFDSALLTNLLRTN